MINETDTEIVEELVKILDAHQWYSNKATLVDQIKSILCQMDDLERQLNLIRGIVNDR